MSALDPLLDVHVCYDGIELREPDAAAAKTLRATLMAGGDFLYGSTGRLEEQKGYEDLVRAAAIVARVNPGARFAVAGEGPLRGRLEALLRQLGLADCFRLLGFRTDIPEFLAALDVFVSPSHWEGGPLTLVEAIVQCKPVVATPVGLTPEVVRAGINGEFVSVHDKDALGAALLLARSKHREQKYATAEARTAAALMDAETCARGRVRDRQGLRPTARGPA